MRRGEAAHTICQWAPTMNSVTLGLRLFATGCVLTVCLAASCNWNTQYESNGKCCDACPPGQYPKEACSTKCEKCTAHASKTWCACINNTSCENKECSSCIPRPRCKGGEQLRRTGEFAYNYVCEPCPEGMFSVGEGSMCELIADCKKIGLDVVFPGNRTHNARCGCQDSDQLTPKIMMVCLSINGVICLALLLHACAQRPANRRRKSKYCPTAHSVVLPCEECSCKLSKEEMGDDCDLHDSDDISEASIPKSEV